MRIEQFGDSMKEHKNLNVVEYKERIKQRQHEEQEHEVSELICLGCRKRWIGVYPSTTLLKDATCECGAVGLIIKTGQTLEGIE